MPDSRYAGRDVEQMLRALGQSLDAAVPDYAERVLGELARGRQGRPSRWSGASLRRIAVAAAAVMTVLAIALVIPTSRHAVASWFGFAGVEIRRPAPTEHPPSTAPTPATLDAGPRVSLAQAERAFGGLHLPAALARPSEVHLERDREAVIVTLAYRTAPGLRATATTGYALVVTEIAHAGDPVMQKILQAGAQTQTVSVRGHSGVFISGPQEIINIDTAHTENGTPAFHEVAPRASANTIIWSDGTVTYRLEADFTSAVAVSLASAFG